jgi:WD40 repeat protein
VNNRGTPRFVLARVPLPGSAEVPRLISVGREDSQAVGRRDILRLGASVPAAAVLASFWTRQAAAADSVIAAHRGLVGYLAATPDRKTLLSASSADGMKKWLLPEGTLDGPFVPALTPVSLTLSPDGSRVALQSVAAVRLYTFPEGSPSGNLFVPNITVAVYSPDGKWLATSEGSQIGISPIPAQPFATLQRERVLQGRSDTITHLEISGGLLISGSRDGRVSAWSFPEGVTVAQFDTGSEIVSMLAIQQGRTIATGHPDGTIKLTSLTDSRTLTTARASSLVVALALGPDGSLVSGTEEGTIDVWFVPSGDRLRTVRVELASTAAPEVPSRAQRGASAGPLTAMAVSASQNSPLVAVGSRSGQIILLDWPALTVRTHLFDRLANGTSATPTYVPSPSPSPRITSPPVTVPGGTITRPCTPTPVPPGYVCTCNCIPGR